MGQMLATLDMDKHHDFISTEDSELHGVPLAKDTLAEKSRWYFEDFKTTGLFLGRAPEIRLVELWGTQLDSGIQNPYSTGTD